MTPQHDELLPEYRVLFLWDRTKRERPDYFTLDWLIETMRLRDKDLISRFVRDEENPDYIFATDKCYYSYTARRPLRRFLKNRKDSIFIFFTYEAAEPDLNVFDYGFTWHPDLKCGDRIIQNFSYMYDYKNECLYTNDLTLEQARKILDSKPRFCNFIYSRPNEPRDTFFRMLSQYKHVDSSGPYLNNTAIKPTRDNDDWYDISIKMKSGYKFSIAMENAAGKGYTSEKIVSSLQAHTVPIYWGDPVVTDFVNPKAFINASDYSSLEELMERVKEVDNNDELWLDMVTQPWQTDEQRERTLEGVAKYDEFMRHIFTQDIKKAKRVLSGRWNTYCRENFNGYVPSIPVRAVDKFKVVYLPRIIKFLKKILHLPD